jgi:hypothetical protein
MRKKYGRPLRDFFKPKNVGRVGFKKVAKPIEAEFLP